jgi:membrane dipeptidase
MPIEETIEARIDKLHQPGLVDMHFDLLMELYERRHDQNVINTDFLHQFQAGGIGVMGAAIYLSDRYLPEMGLRVALDQVARLCAEVDQGEQVAICRSYAEIIQAREAGKIAFIITMEGVEALGNDIDLLRVFFELGVRSIGLTHARRNMAGDGGVFAPSGSSPEGLTNFGRTVVRQCEELGIIVDLAHLNPAGFDDVLAMTSRPLMISHTNPRRYFDMERNSSDEQLKQVADRGGVIGLGAVLISANNADLHLDNFADQIEYVINLAGIDAVGLGFDFFKFLQDKMTESEKKRFPPIEFIPNFTNHSHARSITRKLIERGHSDGDLEKILYGNFMRLFKELL